MKVFYIEDDQEDIELFNDALMAIDSSVSFKSETNCEEALNALKNGAFKPDIIFLDINMPGTNGLDCVKELKKHAHLEDIPVVIYSTHIDKYEMERFSAEGEFTFVQKPAAFSKIIASVRGILERLAK
jgi:DNA-binding NtrC family response regulator